MAEHELDYRIWVNADDREEAVEIINDLLRKAFKGKEIKDWDGPL